MKYLKTFEQKNTIKQQPFFLTKVDYLYLSDDLAKKVAPSTDKIRKKYKNVDYAEYTIKENEYFFNNEKNEKGWHKSTRLSTDIHVRYNYNQYRMDIVIFKGANYDNEAGHFYYYIGGNSGDYDMHGKNMIRTTRDCNLNFIAKFYPIVLHIKDFYKRFKNKELFFDIIRESIIKYPTIAQYGIPKELQSELGHYENIFKYNI
jgi:hypothetical protein